MPPFLTHLTLPVMGALLIAAAPIAQAATVSYTDSHSATVTYSDPECTAFSLDGSAAPSYVLKCTSGGGSVTGAPTNCTISSNPASLTSGGGTFSLTAACGNINGNTVYTWTCPTSDTCTSTAGITTSDTLPLNDTAAGKNYTYTMTACNGSSCASPVTKTVIVPSPTQVTPTCTNATATPNPNPLTSSGGTVALAATCQNAATYSWTRTPAGGSAIPAQSSTTDNAPQNTGSSDQSYSWTVTACNGASNCTTRTTNSVTVPAVAAPPVAGCPTPLTLSWASGSMVTGTPGASSPVVAKITIPSGVASGLGSFTVYELNASLPTRKYTISTTPCDESAAVLAVGYATNPRVNFATITNPYGYPALLGGGTYYFNLWNKNESGALTCSSGTCGVKISLGTP